MPLRIKMVKPKKAGSLFWDCHVLAGHARSAHLADPLLNVHFLLGCPFQVYLRPGIDHPRAQGKGIDIGNGAVDRIVCHIHQPVILGHRPGNGPHQELGLIHPGIIGTDIAVGGVEGAI